MLRSPLKFHATSVGSLSGVPAHDGLHLKVFFKTGFAPLTAIAGLLGAAERCEWIRDRHIDMHHAGIERSRHFTRTVGVAG